MPAGIVYSINDAEIPSPDEEAWVKIVLGDALSGLEKRSGYSVLEWRKQVGDACDLAWFDYDNTALTSLTCRPPDKLDEYERYTDAICKSVVMRQRRSVGNEIVATFLVRLDSTS